MSSHGLNSPGHSWIFHGCNTVEKDSGLAIHTASIGVRMLAFHSTSGCFSSVLQFLIINIHRGKVNIERSQLCYVWIACAWFYKGFNNMILNLWKKSSDTAVWIRKCNDFAHLATRLTENGSTVKACPKSLQVLPKKIWGKSVNHHSICCPNLQGTSSH